MNAFVTAGAGFLAAVLWFDLMFDVQAGAWPGRGGCEGAVLPEPVLASIAGYYARVTTAARPMNRLVAAVMLATLAAVIVEAAQGMRERGCRGSRWRWRRCRSRLRGREPCRARSGSARAATRPRPRAHSPARCSPSTSCASRASDP